MESFIERSCSSRMCLPLMFSGVVIVFDVLKTRDISEFKGIISDVLKREELFQEVSTITLLGALDKVLHPCKFLIVQILCILIRVESFKCLSLCDRVNVHKPLFVKAPC